MLLKWYPNFWRVNATQPSHAGVDKRFLSEGKLNELLKPFESNGEMSVLELFNRVGRLFNDNKSDFLTEMDNNLSDEEKNEKLIKSEEEKPLGDFGQITLNQGIVKLKNLVLRGQFIYGSAKIGVKVIPIAALRSLVGFGFILKNYMKHVHNRPFSSGISDAERLIQKNIRRRNLAIFLVIGAPLMLVSIRKTSMYVGDVLSVEYNKELGDNGNNLNKSGLLFILSNLYKNIPSWLKLLFNLIIITVLVLKLFGISIITDVIFNLYYLKIINYIFCSFGIGFQLLNIYLIHKFSTKNINIPEVFPEFIINWLKSIEVLSSNKVSLKDFKYGCYIEICIYTIICIIFTLITQ